MFEEQALLVTLHCNTLLMYGSVRKSKFLQATVFTVKPSRNVRSNNLTLLRQVNVSAILS